MAENYNFLSNLVKSGALNVYNPMETYTNAANIQLMGKKMKGMDLDEESKLLEISKGYIQRLQNRDDYTKFKGYMSQKMGDRFNSLPESFESEEEFKDWQITATTTADALLKLRQGGEVTISKDNGDGTRSELKVTQKKLESLQKAGMVEMADPKDPNTVGKWRIGNVEGTPWKPSKVIKEESQAAEEGKLEAGADKVSAPYWDDDMKSWVQKDATGKISPLSVGANEQYEPQKFVKPNGSIGWVTPGEEPPGDWKPWSATGGHGKKTVFDTPDEAVAAGKKFEPKGKTTVPKAGDGGYTFEYSTEGKEPRPGEAYKAWETTINTRINQSMKKYGLTDVQSSQITAGQASMAEILADMLSKKKLTKEGAAALNAELSNLEDIRDRGYDEISKGGNPYEHLKRQKGKSEAPRETASSHKSGGRQLVKNPDGTMTYK